MEATQNNRKCLGVFLRPEPLESFEQISSFVAIAEHNLKPMSTGRPDRIVML